MREPLSLFRLRVFLLGVPGSRNEDGNLCPRLKKRSPELADFRGELIGVVCFMIP